MIRRGAWLVAGVVAGAGGSLWSRRRLISLSERARSGEISGDLIRVVEGGSRRVGRRLAVALEAGRVEAHRREGELRRTVRSRQVTR